MTHTTRRPTAPVQAAPPARPLGAGTASPTHIAHCGACGEWLHVDEDELLASLDAPPLCWNCGLTRPDGAPAPA